MAETENKTVTVKLKDAIGIALAKDGNARKQICYKSKASIEELRKEFEALRKAKIEAVAHKHKDDPLHFNDCYRHLMDEVRELDSVVLSLTDDLTPLEKHLIEKELIDVANCAEFAFIALKLKGLETKT